MSERDEADVRFRNELGACLHVARWIDEVASGAPYDSLDALLAVAAAAATPLQPRRDRRGPRESPAHRREARRGRRGAAVLPRRAVLGRCR